MDTRHPSEETLYAFSDEQLDAAAANDVARHIEACEACGAIVADARGFAAAATRIVAALDDVPAKVIPVRRHRRLPPWLAAAAVVVLAVGVSSVAIRSGIDSGVGEEATRSVESAAADAAQESADLTAAAAANAQETSAVAAPTAGAGGRSAEARRASPVRNESDGPPRDVATAAAPERLAAPVASAPAPAPPPPIPSGPAPPASTEFVAPGESAKALASQRQREDSLQMRAQIAAARIPSGRTATITGRVALESGDPVAGASVYVPELNTSTYTDSRGRYELTIPLTVERATVRARAIGYSQDSLAVSVGDVVTADFILRPQELRLGEVVVTGTPAAGERRSRAATEAPTAADAGRTAWPNRITRYRVRPGVTVELREFSAPVSQVQTPAGTHAFVWSNQERTRFFVLTGPLPMAELEALSRRLGELQVIR